MKISLLMTGTELMTGDIVDSNSAKVAEWLIDEGLSVAYKATVPDDLDLLVSEIDRISQFSDVLLINGGLGPTTDDLTAEALSKVMQSDLALNSEALTHLESWCKIRNYELSEENRKQAILPQGVEILPNEVGSAVGVTTTHKQCRIYCTPGVPHELALMFKQAILPKIVAGMERPPKRKRFGIFGYGESAIQRLLKKHFPDWPKEVEVGFRASIPVVELKLSVKQAKDEALLEQCIAEVKSLFGDHIITEDNQTLAEVLVQSLQEKHLKVTTAESCTGGKIASLITEVSGASAVFEASVVSYSNDIKQSVLGVSEASLLEQGAVSEPVVREMLSGALKLSGADLGAAVSGIAGPSGGTPEKPVGTVWLAWGSAQSIKTHCFYLPGNRVFFQQIVAAMALDLLRREVLGIEAQPDYFRSRQKIKA